MKRIFSQLGCGGLICVAASLTPGVLAADSAEEEVAYQPFTIGAEAGTTGFGGAASWRFSDHFGARAGMHYFSYTDDGREIEGVTYDAKLKLSSAPIAVDIFPWKSRSFRITAGVLINQNELTGSSMGEYDLGNYYISIGDSGNVYQTDGSGGVGALHMKVEQQAVSPFLAIGGNFYLDKAKRWSLSGELGVAYTGSPDVTLSTASGAESGNAALQHDLDVETEQLEDGAEKFKFYPIIKVGLNFSF
jgi:hypothetical protein